MEATVARAHKDAALLKLLGYDTRTHGLEPFIGPRWRGLRVLDSEGRPVRFVKEAELAALTPKWRVETGRISRASASYNADMRRARKRRRVVLTLAAAVTSAALLFLWALAFSVGR